MSMTDYAKGLVKQYDKNGDMMLQPEERKELRGRAAEADLNKDGTITIDELVAHLSSNAPSSSSSTPSSSTPNSGTSGSSTGSSSSSGSSSDSKNNESHSKADAELAKRVFVGTVFGKGADGKDGEKRKSYRFSKVTDRMPANLPSWFKSKDKNGNGQVEMREYNSSWSKSSAEEFRRYDANDDGVITPKEAAGK